MVIKEILKRPSNGDDETHILFSDVHPRKVVHMDKAHGVVKPKFNPVEPLCKNVDSNVVQAAYLRRKSKKPATYSQVAEQQMNAAKIKIPQENQKVPKTEAWAAFLN